MDIAVFFGGKSVEHDISVITALQAVKVISKENNIIPIYIKPDGKMVVADNLDDGKIYLDYEKNVKNERDVSLLNGKIAIIKKNKIKLQNVDCALNCCHGHGGEDGSLQGALEIADIPYSSCDCPSSVLCMDKGLCKLLLQHNQIPSVKGVYFDKCKYVQDKQSIWNNIETEIGMPCIIKPATLGSSVGIVICENVQDLERSIESAFEFDSKVLVEKYLSDAREFCCAVIKNSSTLIASKVIEVAKSQIYTFEEKYLQNNSNSQKKLSQNFCKKVEDMAKEAYSALGCDGIVRVDFLLKDEKLYVNELNSIPGSLSFHMFDISFGDLINCLLREGMKRRSERNKLIYKFNSQAIEKYLTLTTNIKK